MLPVRVRALARKDIPFVTSSWLKSYRMAKAVAGVPSDIYYGFHHKVLERLLSHATTLVLVNEEDDNQIFGYCCAEMLDTALVIHYTYIKKEFRRFGLAKRLWTLLLETEKPPAVFYTHKTPPAGAIERKDWWEVPTMFHPYLAHDSTPGAIRR